MVQAVEASPDEALKPAVEANTYGAGVLGELTGGYLNLIVQGQTGKKA